MSHDYESVKLAFMSADLSLTEMCELRELIEGAIAHEQEKIELFTFEDLERPELLSQFRTIRHVLGAVGVRVPETPRRDGEGLKWPAYRLGLPPHTLHVNGDGTWDLYGQEKLSANMPESHLPKLLESHGIDIENWWFKLPD